MSHSRLRPLVCILPPMLLLFATAAATAAPSVFWASDPIRPGETAMVIGDEFGPKPTVEVARLADTKPEHPSSHSTMWPGKGEHVEALQAGEQSVKFIVPAGWKPGVFAYRISGSSGAAVGLLNRPAIWWV